MVRVSLLPLSSPCGGWLARRDSPFTTRQLALLGDLGVTVIDPVEKRLACGDVGKGGLAPPEVIAERVRQALAAIPRFSHPVSNT